jgi:hypothetical protein
LVPPDIQTPILLKIISYDNALKEKCSGTLHIGILYIQDGGESEEMKDNVIRALNKFKNVTVQGLAFDYRVIQILDKEPLNESSDLMDCQILYICSGLDARIAELSAFARHHGKTTITGIESYVRSGLSIGVVLREDKPKILINLEATKAEGVMLDSRVLQLAEIIK